ncbi:hypothetical protein [Actinoplanes regularis]|nr:hypothetical protein [Actinoplanes regularis]
MSRVDARPLERKLVIGRGVRIRHEELWHEHAITIDPAGIRTGRIDDDD